MRGWNLDCQAITIPRASPVLAVNTDTPVTLVTDPDGLSFVDTSCTLTLGTGVKASLIVGLCVAWNGARSYLHCVYDLWVQW